MKINFEISLRNPLFYKKKIQIQYCRDVLKSNEIDTEIQKQPPEVFCKKRVLRNFAKFTGKHLYQSFLFNKVAGQVCNFIKKVTLVQVISSEFCEISKNTFFTEHLRWLLLMLSCNFIEN